MFKQFSSHYDGIFNGKQSEESVFVEQIFKFAFITVEFLLEIQIPLCKTCNQNFIFVEITSTKSNSYTHCETPSTGGKFIIAHVYALCELYSRSRVYIYALFTRTRVISSLIKNMCVLGSYTKHLIFKRRLRRRHNVATSQ